MGSKQLTHWTSETVYCSEISGPPQYSLLSPASRLERASELGQHRLAAPSSPHFSLAGKGEGRRVNSYKLVKQHTLCPAWPTLQCSEHQLFACPGPPCKGSHATASPSPVCHAAVLIFIPASCMQGGGTGRRSQLGEVMFS
jgi:hypothetical protein